MEIGAFRRPRRTRSIALFALPALLLRLLVPAGFMPGLAEDDSLTMQVCHGSGGAGLALPQAPPEGTGGETGADHSAPCLYAASSVAAPPPLLLTGGSGGPLDHDPAPAATPDPPALRSLHRAQSPRAPPFLA